ICPPPMPTLLLHKLLARCHRPGCRWGLCCEAIRLAAVLLSPIMPTSSREILRRVGAPSDDLNFDRDGRWRADGERTVLQEGPLWPRKETTTVTDNPVPPDGAAPGALPPASAPLAPAAAASADNRISIDDFMKVELRTA